MSKELITRARTRLILRHPFFGVIAVYLKPVEHKMQFPAATDGEHLYYYPELIKEYPLEQIETLISHEVLHNAFSHLLRIENRDRTRWNIATDCCVNPILIDAGFTLPDGALYRAEYRGMSAEQIYERIETEKIEAGVYIVKDKKDGEVFEGVLIDEHELWDSITKKLTDAERKKLEDEWKERVIRAVEAARHQGSLPAGLARHIDELVSPKFDWRDLLRIYLKEWVRDNYTWMRPQKKLYAHGIYYPSINEGVGIELGVGLDASGSITKEEFKDFLSELEGIVSSFKRFCIHAFAIDAAIQAYEVLENMDDFDNFRVNIKGGGGTDFGSVFNKIEDEQLNIKVMIWMTDLHAYGIPEKEPYYDIIWLVPRNHGAPPSYGKVIELD